MTRRDKVETAAKQWCKDLTDVSGRNRLLYYRDLRVGTLDLSGATKPTVKRLLEGKPGTKVTLSQLFDFSNRDIFRSDTADSQEVIKARDAIKRARAVSRKAVENFEERGVHTLYLSQGFATWTPQSGKPQPNAPVLMCAAGLHRRGVSETDFDLSLDGEWIVNDALLNCLAREFNLELSAEELLGSKLSDARLDNDEVEEIFGDLRSRAHRIPGFKIEPGRLVMGNFLYKKMPMVNDILSNLDTLAHHDLIAAIAGDENAREALRREHTQTVDPRRPDTIPLADEYLVLDADSTQNQAINAALAGESFVLQGPPGTGKSQTISNLISTMMARGKSVLFVAEKRAAIDAVFKRLTKAGLDDFVIDLHGGTVRRRELARQLDQSLNVIGQTPPTKQQDLYQSLEDPRNELSGYAKALHQPRSPWGLSFFEVQDRLLEIKNNKAGSTPTASQVPFRSSMRIPTDVLGRLDSTTMRLLRGDLTKWADLSVPFLFDRPSPWADSCVTTTGNAIRAQDMTLDLVETVLDTQGLCFEMLNELGLPEPGPVAAWNGLFDLLSETKTAGTRPDPEPHRIEYENLSSDLEALRTEHEAAEREVADITQRVAEQIAKSAEQAAADQQNIQQQETESQDAARLVDDLTPASKGALKRTLARTFRSRYRAAKREMATLLGEIPPDLTDIGALKLAMEARAYAQRLLESLREQARWNEGIAIQQSGCLEEERQEANHFEREISKQVDSLEQVTAPARDKWQEVGRKASRWDLEDADRARRWEQLGGKGIPRVPSHLTPAMDAFRALLKSLADMESVLPGHSMKCLTFPEAVKKATALKDDLGLLNRLPELAVLERNITGAGIGKILQLARQTPVGAEDLVTALDEAWLTAIRSYVLLTDRRVGTFESTRQSRLVNEFRQGDAAHLRHTPARIRRKVAEHAVRTCNTYRDQDELIRREAAKKTRHLPLRRLFEKAPDVLTALRPCWAMSPLDVAQTLPARPLFDVVVFDEASQVLPCDAICALSRGRRVVVAGDARQLPPTVFFDGVGSEGDDDDDDEAGSLTDYESILDVMSAMLSRRSITWHYRSQDERLIAFSNRNIYHGTLTTFPGASTDQCLGFELVEHRAGQSTDTRSNPDEVRRVVELMIQHARERPDESLGVIAMGRYHADRIEQRLRYRLREEDSQQLEEFFREEVEERAFVKNLERVQGDERDAIILSIGYGKNAGGRLIYRFGPLNVVGGERRLNVAITRARRRLTLVSSFSHTEMDPNRSSAEGVRKLRSYLKYVESGGNDLGNALEGAPLNPFEVDVLDKLTAAGLEMIPQYGYSGYRIDFAVRYPGRPGQFVLAVEADGASYHSSATARDRDRLRQEHLERLGWRFCRIWSTDWFRNHRREVDKVMDVYRRAVAETNSGQSYSLAQRYRHSDGLADTTPIIQQRGTPPHIQPKQPITEYDPHLLVDLALWVMSDECLRTDDQIFEEMFQKLGYGRRGTRIREALYTAIKGAKQRL